MSDIGKHICLLFSVLAGLGPAMAQEPAGMVLQDAPGAVVIRNGRELPLRLADILYSEDRLHAAQAEIVFLYCPTAERIRLKAGSSVHLYETSLAVLKGEAPLREPVRGCALPKVALGSESLERIGGLRARGSPPIPVYLGGKISTTEPVFTWKALPEVEGYELVVSDELGATLWEQHGTQTRVVYPDSAPALKEGLTYRWRVKARKGGEVLAQQDATFTVDPAAGFSGPLPEDPAGLLMRAVELENAGYWAEAAACYRCLRTTNPEDERLARHLAWLYWNAGLIAAYNDELAK